MPFNFITRMLKQVMLYLCLFLPAACNAADSSLYSINLLSFVYHAYAPHRQFNQYFNNELVLFEKRLDYTSPYNVVAGTIINSEDNRCVLLGGGRHYWREGQWSVEGLYMYAGEFFIKPFSHCGDAGVYNKFKQITGFGFAPYIYHGVKYDFNRYVSAKAGVILPGIIVINTQLSF